MGGEGRRAGRPCVRTGEAVRVGAWVSVEHKMFRILSVALVPKSTRRDVVQG